MNKSKQETMDSDLDWKELEIMSFLALKKETHKKEIINVIKQRFPNLRDKPNSSLYLIFERLRMKGLISVRKIAGKGHRTFVSLTDMGRKQINNVLQWSFQLLAPTFIQLLISDINAECEPFFSCTSPSRIAFIGPTLLLSTDNFFSRCNSCPHRSDQKRYFLKMPYNLNADIPDCETISCTPNDIPIKDKYFNNLLSLFSLSLLKTQEQRKSFLKELNRILASHGKIFLVELKQFRSFIYNVILSFTDVFAMIFTNNSNRLYRFELDELLKLIQQTFRNASVILLDYAEFVFVKIEQ